MSNTTCSTSHRIRRLKLLIALLAVIALGLASRAYPDAFPGWVVDHAGDALWTMAAYLSLAFLFPQLKPLTLATAAFVISVAVELSQLIDWRPLNAIRQNRIGKLLLGQGFLWIDLPRYFVGATLIGLMDGLLNWRRKNNAEQVTESTSETG